MIVLSKDMHQMFLTTDELSLLRSALAQYCGKFGHCKMDELNDAEKKMHNDSLSCASEMVELLEIALYKEYDK